MSRKEIATFPETQLINDGEEIILTSNMVFFLYKRGTVTRQKTREGKRGERRKVYRQWSDKAKTRFSCL